MRSLGRAVAAVLVVALAACERDGPTLAVYGDSTAIGIRGDLVGKVTGLMPSMDADRWFNRLARTRDPRWIVKNHGKGAATAIDLVGQIRSSSFSDKPTIIYDRMNNEEEPQPYVTAIAEGIALLQTDKFLILPQIGIAGGGDQPERIARMDAIDAAVRRRWPNNSFTEAEAASLASALSFAATRGDGLHRSPVGQAIEAAHIGRWIDRAGW